MSNPWERYQTTEAKPWEQYSEQPEQQNTIMQDVGQGIETAYSAATLGFGDELAGLGGAIAGKAANIVGIGDNKSFAEDYRTIRDKYRGDVAEFAKENPMSALGLEIGGSLATAGAGLTGQLGRVVPQGAGMVQRAMASNAMGAAKTGAAFGGVSGAGNSQNIEDVPVAALIGAALGGGMGAASVPLINTLGAVGGNIGQRFSGKHAENAARVKVAEALERDVRGEIADPYLQAQARMEKLGPQSTIADAAGESTRGLLDTVATLPGKTKDAISNLIHERQAKRGSRMFKAADEALGTQGANASKFTADLINKRSAQSAPLYAKVNDAPIPVDNELLGLLTASSKYHAAAQDMALVRQEIGIGDKLIDGTLGATVSLKHLDQLKRTLYDAAQAQKNKGELSSAKDIHGLRIKLINKLDDASPKDAAGNSIYKKARETFAGESELIEAVDVGRKALNEGADEIRDLMAGMGRSEIEAFRVGVLQSMKDKLGTEAGQTSMIKMWKEEKTSSRLKEVFGNDYRKFASEVAKEARLKRIEGVGKGSQTASRQYGAGDLDALPIGDISSAVVNAKAGNLAGLASSLSSAWNKVKMPEKTRNEIGRILMSKNPAEIAEAEQYMLRSLGKQKARAGSVAAEFGYVGGGLQ